MADERVSDVSYVSDRRSLQRSTSLPSLQRSISLPSLPCFDIGSGERFHDNSLSVDLSASMVSKSTRPMLNSKSPSRRPDEGGLINIENAASILIGNRELESLKSKELKRELIARNLDSSGKKSALVDRLRKFIQNSRQNQTLDGNRNHANGVNTTGQRPTEYDCPCSTHIGDLKSEIEQIKKTLNIVSDGEVVVVKSSAEQSNRVAKIEEENRTLRLHLASLKDQNSQLVEERDSLKLAIQLISKDLHQLHLSHNQGSDIQKSVTAMSPSIEHSLSNRKRVQATPSPPGNESIIEVQHQTVQEQQWSKVVKKKKKRRAGNRVSSQSNVVTSDNSNTGQPKPQAQPKPQGQANDVTVIVGDSMVKRIDGYQLGRKIGQKVVVKPFLGATVADMEHHVKPTMNRSPARIVVHVGTNDLQSRNPQQIADNIVDLARNIESNSKAEVLISELITRRDQNARGVDAINKSLRRYCSQNGWKLIRHNNISQTVLNKGGLHLNQVGNETFFNNFIKALGSN